MKIISPSSSLSLLFSSITNCLFMVGGDTDFALFWPVLGVVAVLSGVDVEDVVFVGGDGVIVVVVVVVAGGGGDVVAAAVELAVDFGAVGIDGIVGDAADDVDGVVVVGGGGDVVNAVVE